MAEKEKSNKGKTINGKKEKEEKGIVESFLEGIPIVGKLIEELGKTEIFKEKLKETDEKIKENLRKGKKKKMSFEASISTRPIFREVKRETKEVFIGKDYFYGKKGRKMILGVKVPKKEVGVKIGGKNLFIGGKSILRKKIELPDYYKNIRKKHYKKGILVLELTK